MFDNDDTSAGNVDTNTGEPSGRRGAPKKPEWDLSEAIDAEGNNIALDEKGRLTGVPVNFIGDTEHKKLSKRDFVSDADHLEYENGNLRARVDRLNVRIARNDEDIEALRAGRKPRGQLLSMQERLQAKLAEIQAALDDEEDDED